jgi:spermidine/putrescine transport system permease protein
MGERRRWHWGIAPAVTILLTLFVAPLGTFLAISFWRVQLFKLTPAFTLENYAAVGAEYHSNLAFTIGMALVISLVATVLAFGFAYALRFALGRWANPMLFLVMVSMFGGYLIKIYAWKTILGTYGLINTFLLWLGVIREPLGIFIYNPGAVAVALIHYLFPFAVLPIYAALRNIDDITLEAARDVGAHRWQVFRDVVLPQARPGIAAAMTFSFLIAAGDFVTPSLVGGTKTLMVGSYIHSQFVESFNWPLGAALATSTLVTSAVVLGVIRWSVSRLRPHW